MRTATPEDAVPARRMPYDLAAPVLLLHTIQPMAVWEQVERDGRFVADTDLSSLAEEPQFRRAYEWLFSQMRSRLGVPTTSAVWFWARTTRRHLVEACRAAVSQESDQQVLLTCRIPRHRVLLGDFDAWHAPLNQTFWVQADRELGDDEFARLYDAVEAAVFAGRDLHAVPFEDWPDDARARAESTWESVFDLRRGARVQATCAALEREDVVDVVRLVSRAAPRARASGSRSRRSGARGGRPPP